MDYQPKPALVNSEYDQDDCSKLGGEFASILDDDDNSNLYSSQAMTMEVDVSLEWLSAFVEECLSTKAISLPIPTAPTTPRPLSHPTPPSSDSPFSHLAAVPGKARSKRRRMPPSTSIASLVSRRLHQLNKHSLHLTSSSADHPLLLQQTYWLADSELLLPARGGEREKMVDTDQQETTVETSLKMQQQQRLGNGRRCSHCQAQRTPQWRGGPLGPKTLCNACGVRYKKSGRLLPEYRPANSPTFVSFLHSNSHKRVMEMRMMNASSSTTTSPSSS